MTEDPTAPPPQTNELRWLFIAVHIVVTGAGVLMIMLAPHEVGGWYFFASMLVLLIGSNVVVALMKRFLATPNNRWRGP
jgi:hypothetical protein